MFARNFLNVTHEIMYEIFLIFAEVNINLPELCLGKDPRGLKLAAHCVNHGLRDL